MRGSPPLGTPEIPAAMLGISFFTSICFNIG